MNTTRKMEGKGASGANKRADVVRKVQIVLEAAGIEFLNHGRPCVRLRAGGSQLNVSM